MKVLHVETGRHLYGGARQVQYLMIGLQARGVDCYLACARRSAIALTCREKVAGLYTLPMAGDLDVRLTFSLVSLIKRLAPDLVHLHSRRGADIYGALAATISAVPVVLSRRVDNPEPRWLVALKYRRYDRVIAISRGIRRILLDEGVPAEKVVCVPSAVDVAEYQNTCDRCVLRAEFGLSPDTIVAGIIAQLIPRKGHQLVLRALSEVLQQQPNLHIIFFGKGPLEAVLRAQTKQAGLSAAVHFAGFRDDLHHLLGCLDFQIHPALLEGLGVALLQGAAAGLPLIGTRTGGIPEIVLHEETGLLVEPGDVPALTRALIRLAGDPQMRRRLGTRARQHVTSNFGVDAMIEGNLAVYRTVLQTAGAG